MTDDAKPEVFMPPFGTAFDEADADRAHREWGANCGPCALAACIGWSLDDLRPKLADFEQKRYMSPTTMKDAISATSHRWLNAKATGPFIHGLARVQWEGPWTKPGVPARVAYGFTHWVARKRVGERDLIFDINGGWRTQESWEQEIVPLIIASIRRADGNWHFTHQWEIRKDGAA